MQGLIINSINTCFILLIMLCVVQAQEDKTELIFQKGHHEPIIVMAQSPDGKTLVTGGTGLTLRFRDLETGLEFKTFRSQRWLMADEDGRITRLEYSKDGKYLLCRMESDAFDHLLTIRLKDDKVVFENFEGGLYQSVTDGFFTPDGKSVVYCYMSAMVMINNKIEHSTSVPMKIFNLKTGEIKLQDFYRTTDKNSSAYEQEHVTSFLHDYTITPNEQLLLTMGINTGLKGNEGEVVFVTDANTGKAQSRIVLPDLPKDHIFTIVPDQDNKHFYVIPASGFRNTCIYWQKYNILTGKLVEGIPNYGENSGLGISLNTYTKNGKWIYTYYDSIYITTPGKFEVEEVQYAKTAKGNTSVDNIKQLGKITAIRASLDGNSIFVAFAGKNKRRAGSSNPTFDSDFLSDIVTIREIDLKTWRVLREYTSLGKMVNTVQFDPKGRSLWATENNSSYDFKYRSALNVWKFRELGSLYLQKISKAPIDQLVFSPRGKECILQEKDGDNTFFMNAKDLSWNEIELYEKAQPGEQYLFSLPKFGRDYDGIDLLMNTSYTTIWGEDDRLFQLTKNTFNSNTYLGKVELPKLNDRKALRFFGNEGKELVVLDRGKSENGTAKGNTLYFYDINSQEQVGELKLKGLFWYNSDKDRVTLTTSTDNKFLAIAAPKEYRNEMKETSTLYLVDLTQHAVHKEIPLKVDICFPKKVYNLKTKKTSTLEECVSPIVSTLIFSPDNKQLLGGWIDNSIKVWDIATGNLIRTLKGHSNQVESIAFHPKKSIMASASQDGQIIFWNTETWTVLAKMIMIEEDDYIVYTQQGYYMATPKALDWVAFKKGDELYGFDQFDLKYNRPDIVMDSLGLMSSSMIRMLKKAYQKRLKKLGVSTDDLGQLHAPVLRVEGEIPYEAQQANLEFRVGVEDSKEELQQLNVYINDVPVYGLTGKPFTSGLKSAKELVQLQLSEGINNIILSVTNKKGVESLRKRVVVEYNKPSATKPDLHLVMVGVSNYKEANRNLTFAAKDAEDIMNSFARQRKHYTTIHKHLLVNEEATTANVLALLEKLKNTNIDDKVVLYFSCHGLLDSQLDYYLAMHETDFENPENGGLSYKAIEQQITNIGARQRLVFIDACHSGEVDKTEVERELKDSTTTAEKDVAVRSKSGDYVVKPKVGLKNSFAYMQMLFADVSKGTGATIVSAAGGMEFALESDDWQNSVFAYAILKGIQERKADLNRDGYIRISELQRYVKSTVYEMTNGKQVPTTRQVNRFGDFYIYKR